MTAAFTLMGGAGTTCMALDPTGFGGNNAEIAPYQWLYISFVLITIGIGVLGVRAVMILLVSLLACPNELRAFFVYMPIVLDKLENQ